jgi:hypothetical protein
MTVEKYPYYDDDHYVSQMEINARAMGRVIHDELARCAEQSTRNRIIETMRINDDEMFIGELLDGIAKMDGYESVAPTWYALEKMQTEGLVVMYFSDGNRFTVCLTRSCK